MITIFGDLHINTHYTNRTDNVIETFKEKLLKIKDIAEQTNSKYIVCLGDFFDKPVMYSQTGYELFNWLIDYFKDLRKKFKIYFVLGNHDIYMTNTNLNYTMIGSLVKLNLIEIVDTIKLPEFEYPVRFLHYHKFITKKEFNEKIQTVKDSIVFSHYSIIPPDFIINEIGMTVDDAIKCNNKIWFNGHIHKETVTDTFINTGSSFRVSREDYFMYQVPSVYVLDTNYKYKSYPLTNKKYDEVFKTKITKSFNDINYDDVFKAISKIRISGINNEIITEISKKVGMCEEDLFKFQYIFNEYKKGGDFNGLVDQTNND